MVFLFDKKVLLGIGIGLIIGTILMSFYQFSISISDSQIEERARGLGMHFNNECKAIFRGED